MNILITGAHGQLGRELEQKLKPLYSVICQSKEEMDITDKKNTEKIIEKIKPNLIIHTAAFTKVDQCELDRKKAFEVNAIGAGNVAHAANKVGAKVFYISSDYVFDGSKKSPYHEEDEPNPRSIYGLSKWMGEKLVLNINNGTVIRTSWLFGHEGKNFVKTMMKLAMEGTEVKVVNDQIGSPTYVSDLSDTIMQLFNRKNGIYHVSNSGSCSWYDFAQAIFKEIGSNPEKIIPTTSAGYNALAPRPHYSILGQNALVREQIQILRPWEEALKEFIRKEKANDRRC